MPIYALPARVRASAASRSPSRARRGGGWIATVVALHSDVGNGEFAKLRFHVGQNLLSRITSEERVRTREPIQGSDIRTSEASRRATWFSAGRRLSHSVSAYSTPAKETPWAERRRI
jgi:hypothetical protein